MRSTNRRRRTSRPPIRTSRSRSPRSSSPEKAWSCSARSSTAYGVDDLHVGGEVELVVETLFEDDDNEYRIWTWKPRASKGSAMSDRRTEIAVLGVGMHPWGKWGRNFVEYGVDAAQRRARRRRAHVARHAVRRRRATRCATATRATSPARRSPRPSAGRASRWPSCYAACASGATALDVARAQILAGLCDVALVVGADTTPKGFLAPNAGDRPDDPDWLRFRLLGATNPTYFALYARRRMDLYGATERDFAKVQGEERAPRPRQPERALPQGGQRWRTCSPRPSSRRPAAPARHLRDVRRRRAPWSCRRMEYARRHGTRGRRCGCAASRRSRRRSRTRSSRCPNFATDSSAALAPPPSTFRDSIAAAAYEEAGLGPDDMSTSPRCTTCRPPSSSTGTRTSASAARARPSSCSTTATPPSAGGRPVNPSGGLACFGEAVPAQAIAQVCEITWQLRGEAGDRQVEGATRRPHRQPGPVRPRLLGHALKR